MNCVVDFSTFLHVDRDRDGDYNDSSDDQDIRPVANLRGSFLSGIRCCIRHRQHGNRRCRGGDGCQTDVIRRQPRRWFSQLRSLGDGSRRRRGEQTFSWPYSPARPSIQLQLERPSAQPFAISRTFKEIFFKRVPRNEFRNDTTK